MSLQFVIVILFLHWLADFVCQSDWMAKGKSSSEIVLSVHILVYSLVMVIGLNIFQAWLRFPATLNEHVETAVWSFCILNGLLHWITDWFTSRATKRLWAAQQVHWFFVVIGFDQFIHLTCLLSLSGMLR